ncbi:MAG: hypothetical protein RIT27_106 [Pseudomonadota bacterium]|jgi:hypothetical protein
MFERFLVLSASHGVLENGNSYASLIVTNGRYSRLQRDNKGGLDAQKMRCTPELAKKLIALNHMPCIADVDFELDGAKGVPFAFDAKTFENTTNTVMSFFADLFLDKTLKIPANGKPVSSSAP